MPNAVVRQWLVVICRANAPNVSVNLLDPGQMSSDRVNILDFRVGKVMRYGGHRALIALDLYNALNLDTVLVQNFTFRSGRRVAGSFAGSADSAHGEDHRSVRFLELQSTPNHQLPIPKMNFLGVGNLGVGS